MNNRAATVSCQRRCYKVREVARLGFAVGVFPTAPWKSRMLLGSMRRYGHSVWYGAVVVSITAWGLELAWGSGSVGTRLILAAVSLAVIAAATLVSQRESQARFGDMRRFLAALCDDDLEQRVSNESLHPAIPFVVDSSWSDLLERLSTRVIDLDRRARECQFSRSGAEVRSRRIVSERDQLREILSAINDSVIVVDAYNSVSYANTPAERHFGLQLSADSYGPLQGSLDHETLRGLLTETRKRNGNASRGVSLTLTDCAGKQCDFRVTARVLPSSSTADTRNVAQSLAVVFTDIGAQRALQQRNAEFVSSVSHEMKTPLAGIRAYAELLVDGEADDEATREEFLGVIQSQAERLQRLVENLLNLARIEAGVVKVQKKPQSLNEVLQQAFHVLSPTADLKRIEFTWEPSSMYLGVFADHDTLLQAAINLGSNAIKYTPPGGQVVLRSRMNDHEIAFELQDSGVGLSEEDRLKVFEKFYRVAKDGTMAPGTGLGLPLVKHIVEDIHGGRIEVQSELGCGSTFRVVLPANDQIKHV